MAARKQATSRRKKSSVTIDPGNPDAGKGGVIPPEETRFQPGESGNPNGRPKGSETSLACIWDQELERLVEGNPAYGDKERITRRRRLVRLFIEKAEGGDMRMAKLFLDRLLPVAEAQASARPPIILHFDRQDANA